MEGLIFDDGFVPVDFFATTYEASGASVAPQAAHLLEPTAPPAVIPLPAPVYAGAALLALTLLARRAILRAC